MGSSLFPNYTLEKNPYIKLRFWQIFQGVNKTSGDKVSVFIFEKKNLDKKSESEQKTILQLLKRQPESLLKIKNNHKNILKVIEPIAEDSYSIGFITEYVNYNLKEWIKEVKPNKFEIKYIIYQIISIIITLHNDYQISVNNLNIENIFINNENNFIKISELNLSTSLIQGKNNYSNVQSLSKIYEESFMDLKYCFPELIFDNNISNNSDNYLIGLISYFLIKNSDENLFALMDNTIESYKNSYNNTNIDKKIKKFRDDIIEEFLKNLLENNPDKRKNLLLMQNSKFFTESEDNANNNNKLITLCLLSKMDSLELSKNYELLKKLPNILNLYSKKEQEFLILPNLLYFLKKENLINPIIPSLFLLCEQCKPEINFSSKIWPYFKSLFNMKKLPAAALFHILKKISFFFKNLEKEEFNKNCIPLICKALDCGVQKIQEVILEELPKILNDLDKNEFKNSIYNRLINIILQTKNGKLKTSIMNFLLNICDYLDSYFINNKFLDSIDKIVKAETTLITCKNAFILYEKIESKVNDKSIRSKIIPCLLLMMCSGEISEDLFNKGEKIIKDYIKKIKEKRKDQFVKEIVEVNINDNYSDEIKENPLGNNLIKNKNKNNNYINEIGMNSPLSVSKTKSTLSGNISLLEYNSSEDSNLELKLKKTKNKITEKKLNINNNNIYNYNSNLNDNLFDNLLADDKIEENASFDSNLTEKNQSKNILKFVDKKEFLSSLELKHIEAKKNMIENNTINNLINKKETENKNKEDNKEKNIISNLWEEIDSDDENNNENLNKFIKKKKKSGSIKDKEKEKENNNINNKSEKSEKIKSNKKWDEDEEEDNNDIINNIDKSENKNISNNNTENKDTNDDKGKIKNNSSNKKKIKKKKKKKKEKENNIKDDDLKDKINNIEIKEKENDLDKNISTTKMNMEKRAENINFEDLLGD